MCFLWKCFSQIKNNDAKSELWDAVFEDFEEVINESARKSINLSFLKKIKHIFVSYLKKLLSKHISEYRVNLETGHVFYASDKNETSCKCGLFTAKSNDSSFVGFFSDDFLDLEFEDFYSILNNSDQLLCFNEQLNFRRKFNLIRNETNIKHIDCFESKVNGLKIARDILSTIMQIGVFVHN